MHESDESEDEDEMQLPSLFDGVTSLSEEEERTCALLEAMFKDTENEAYEVMCILHPSLTSLHVRQRGLNAMLYLKTTSAYTVLYTCRRLLHISHDR